MANSKELHELQVRDWIVGLIDWSWTNLHTGEKTVGKTDGFEYWAKYNAVSKTATLTKNTCAVCGKEIPSGKVCTSPISPDYKLRMRARLVDAEYLHEDESCNPPQKVRYCKFLVEEILESNCPCLDAWRFIKSDNPRPVLVPWAKVATVIRDGQYEVWRDSELDFFKGQLVMKEKEANLPPCIPKKKPACDKCHDDPWVDDRGKPLPCPKCQFPTQKRKPWEILNDVERGTLVRVEVEDPVYTNDAATTDADMKTMTGIRCIPAKVQIDERLKEIAFIEKHAQAEAIEHRQNLLDDLDRRT